MDQAEFSDIKNLLKDLQYGHDFFQIEYFMVGNQVDDWSRYQQALREIETRLNDLASIEEDICLKGQVCGLKYWFYRFINPRMAEIILARRRRGLEALRIKREAIKHELQFLAAIARRLKKKLGAFDEAKKRELIWQSWLRRARRYAAIDLLTVHHISKPTMEMILSLPEKMKSTLLVELSQSDNPMRLLNNSDVFSNKEEKIS